VKIGSKNMTSKTILNIRKVGGYYFTLYYLRRSELTLDFYLNQFNEEDYWIYKSTDKFREVTYEDLLEFKYANYIFFKKDIYNKEHIDKWVEFIDSIGGIKFLNKPFPPFNPSKIIIKK